MPSNTRFAVAIHTAGVLALGQCIPMNSDSIARSVNTNPVVVRRVIALLARHGLVKVRKGQGGGATLARPAEKITLDQIYLAVEKQPLLPVPILGPKHACPVGRHVGPVLTSYFDRAEAALLEELRNVALADVIREVRKAMKSEVCRSK